MAMRRFIVIGIFLLAALSSLWAAPTGAKITIEGVEYEIYELSEAHPQGQKLTQNPANHKISLSLRKYNNTNPPTFRNSDYAAEGGQVWQLTDGLRDFYYFLSANGTEGGKKFELTWRCYFFEADADTQISYQMERLDVFYQPDGTDLKLLNSYRVQTPEFNTFKARGQLSLTQPIVKAKVKFLIKCYIRKREAVGLTKVGLESYSPLFRYATSETDLTGTPPEGSLKTAKGETKVWKNTIFLLAIDTNKNFNLSPKDKDGNPYQHTIKENYTLASPEASTYAGKTGFGWLVTGEIKEWSNTPPLLQIRFTESNIKLYSFTESELKPEVGGIYKLPKGTEFVIRAKGKRTCDEITALKLKKQGGEEESLTCQFVDGEYRATYRIEENIDDITTVVRDKEYTINYETQMGDVTLKVVEGMVSGGVFTTEGEVPSGARRSPPPCGKQLRLKVTKGVREIEAILCFSANYPAGFSMSESPANSGFYSFPLNADITKFEVKFKPVMRTVKFNPAGGCGMLSVQDDGGTPLTPIVPNTSATWEFIVMKVSGIPVGKYFRHFHVTYKNVGTKDVLHDPEYAFDPNDPKYIAKLALDDDIENIEVVCGDILSLKFTGTNYEVTLAEGKYIRNGNLVSEVGHVFQPNTAVGISTDAKINIAVSAAYPLRPLTKLTLTHEDASTQEYTLTLAQRAVSHTMVKSVTEIMLDEPNYLSATYETGAGKPKLTLKAGQAYDKSSHAAVTVGHDLPTASWILNSAQLELNVVGVLPSAEDKRIAKYIVKMVGGDKEFLPATPDKSFAVTGDITAIEVVEEDDPAVTGPFTLAWNENAAVYTLEVTYDGATSVVNNSTQIPKGKEVTIKLTLVDAVAGEVKKIVPTLDNGVIVSPLTPTVSGGVYLYKYTMRRNTTLQIDAQNHVTWPVNYVTPADRRVFVGTSKMETESIPSGSSVRDQTTIYIRIDNTAPDAENYTLSAVKVNGVAITEKDDIFYTYKVTAAVTSIEAEFTSKPMYTVTYQASQPPVSLAVKKRIGGAIVSSGASVFEGTELVLTPSVTAGGSEDPILVVKKVMVIFEGQAPEEVKPDASYQYLVKVTKNIIAITVETAVASKYKVSFVSGKSIVYLVCKDDKEKTPLLNNAEVEDGTKILIQVTLRSTPTATPQELVIRRNNPNYTEGSSQPKYFLESILTKVLDDGVNTYYWYVVHSDVTIQAYFEEQDLPLLSFCFASKPGEYTLEARVGSPKGKELVEGQIYNYPSGTLFYVKVTLDPSKPNHRISHTFVNGMETNLEKQGDWYVVPLRGDILDISFELKESASSMSLLTYRDPVGAKLEIYNQGQLVPSGAQLPQGTELFAVVSRPGSEWRFSMLTVNGVVSLPPFLSQKSGKTGMLFKMSQALETEVVAYIATPLPEEEQPYYITVEKPLYGSLKLRRLPDSKDVNNSGETKEARAGEKFELNAQYTDKSYELVSNSIEKWITTDPVLHTPVFTVPTLPPGVHHIRVVVVYAPVRPTFRISWEQTSGGVVSAENTSDNNSNVPLYAKVPQGDFVRYRLVADAGYRIKQCVVNGETVVTGTVTSYESVFRMESDLSLIVSFEPDPTNPNKPDDPNDKPSAVDEVSELAGVSVVPNPFTTQLYLRGNVLSDLRYELLDAQGVLRLRGELSQEPIIRTESLASGLYLLRLVMPDGRSKTYRVVK